MSCGATRALWHQQGEEGDAAIADECARRSLPAIFVGEARGGCTGSATLWGRAAARPRALAEQLGSIWRDVVCWPRGSVTTPGDSPCPP